jgi:hypothetical protein
MQFHEMANILLYSLDTQSKSPTLVGWASCHCPVFSQYLRSNETLDVVDNYPFHNTSSEHVLRAPNIPCSQKNTCIKSDPHRYSRVAVCHQAKARPEVEFPQSASTSSAPVPGVFAVLFSGLQM